MRLPSAAGLSPPAAPPFNYPPAARRKANTTAIAAGIGAGVLGLVLVVGLIWGLGAGNYLAKSDDKPSKAKVQEKVIPDPPPPPQKTGGLKTEVVPPPHPLRAQDPINRFQVGSRWSIDWQSMFRYQGVMKVQQQLAPNRYLTRITVNFRNKNKWVAVAMDGHLTVNGNDVLINCSNASESWWDTDDFYLKWHNDTMTGHNIDKKGRRGNAVFQFVPE